MSTSATTHPVLVGVLDSYEYLTSASTVLIDNPETTRIRSSSYAAYASHQSRGARAQLPNEMSSQEYGGTVLRVLYTSARAQYEYLRTYMRRSHKILKNILTYSYSQWEPRTERQVCPRSSSSSYPELDVFGSRNSMGLTPFYRDASRRVSYAT